MKRLIFILPAFLCFNISAQKTDSIYAKDYTYQQVADLVKFPELHYLEIYSFNGAYLPDIFDQFPQLEYLEINDAKIKSVPASIGKLSRLKTLIICNGRTDLLIPAEIGKLTQLSRLRIYNHHFETVPPEIGNLVNLEDIMLCGDLTDLPASVSNWKKLKSLYLSGNQFTKLPSPLFQLPQLEHLNLSRNQINELNDSIRLLKQLQELELDGNTELKTLPSDICELDQLENLFIQNTKIPSLPPCLNQLPDLKRIVICKTIIDNPETMERIFNGKIEWDWKCWKLEKELINFDETYGSYKLDLTNKKDTMILHYGYVYNEPGTIDEEYSQNITLKILNKDSLKLNHIYTAHNPNFILSSDHFSIWDWSSPKEQKITGYLLFKAISKKEVQVYLNLDLLENGEQRKLVNKFLTFD
jgi:hypothetical protein